MTLSRPEYQFLLRNDFMGFVERSFYELNPETDFVSGPHIEAIAAKLEACRLGKIKRLIINLPPRNLKSHCTSIAFAAWFLGHDPSRHVICASYGQDLADKLARDCRTVMNSSLYKRLFRTRLSDRQAVHDFMTTAQGTRLATSVGGVLTGRGGDLILIDDPQKPDEALSETRRNAVNDWYDNTLMSRLNSKADGCIVIIMQRLHQDDLVGHVLEQGHWDVLSLSAIAEADETHVIETPYGRRLFVRKEGEALHPERESLAVYANIRQTIGEYNFLSQYQQTPTPVGGAMVKTHWVKYYKPDEQPEQFAQILQSWDTANKATELADYSVCTTWGTLYKRYYLLNVFRRRLNYPDLKRAVIAQALEYKANTVLIEDKASGTQLIQDLQNEGVIGVTEYKPPPGTDKIMRLHAQTAMFENGYVLLPSEAPWLNDFVKELTSFPGTKYDDQVDSTTQALHHLAESHDLEVWMRLGQTYGPIGPRLI
jgi:predicted phage terminase large subunit-like protein